MHCVTPVSLEVQHLLEGHIANLQADDLVPPCVDQQVAVTIGFKFQGLGSYAHVHKESTNHDHQGCKIKFRLLTVLQHGKTDG